MPEIVFSTTQVSDELFHNGLIHKVYNFSLSDEFQTRFENYRIENPDRFYEMSSNWDGLYFKLKIKNNRLYLVSLKFDCDLNEYPKAEDIIGKFDSKEGIFASWFSGEVIEYFGEPYLAHMSSHSRIFEFKNGILIGIQERVSKGYQEYQKRLSN